MQRRDASEELGDTLKGVAVRRLGPLNYTWGVEHVKAFEPAAIKALSAGVPVRIEHGGKTIGRTANGRADGDVLRADLLLDELPPPNKRQISLGYVLSEVRADGEQVIGLVTEVAMLERGRCGETCSIDNSRADHDLQASKDRATLIIVGPSRTVEFL